MNQSDFRRFALNDKILEVIRLLSFKQPTQIQAKVIPKALKGESVIGKSHTGSGKTHAFLLPIFNRLDEEKKEVQFVITAPTRELASQIYDEVRKIIQLAGKQGVWTSKLLIGGTDKQKMVEKLKQPPHIIVGTPGRILDLVKENALSIYSATSFVIDEADLMADLGFIEDIDQLLIRCKEDIQLLVFSATIPVRLEHFLQKYLEHPAFIEIEGHLSPETMEHLLIAKRHRDESDIIKQITQIIQPYLAIIFTNGKKQADDLSMALGTKGISTGLIHGGLSPRERKRALKDIQQLRYQYIVATDLASRGIDIKGVSHVINAQMPKEEEFYIHRVGRTARAGMEGTAISLYTDEDIPLIRKLEEKGINFAYVDVKHGEIVEAKAWNARNLRKSNTSDLEKEAWKRVKKAKKVKPGYKKKMKKQQQAIKRQLAKKLKRRT